jgi:hypothetical protein
MTFLTISTTPGQPVVAGMTPFTLTAARVPGAEDWPPFLDAERLAQYDDYIALVENRAADVFPDLQLSPGQKEKIALAVALPELLCNVWADAVWGDEDEHGVEIRLPNDAAQTKWDLVAEALDYEMTGWESVFGCAARGTSVLQIGRDERMLDITGTELTITEISPSIYFPVLRPGSARIVEAVVLAWEAVDLNDARKLWQYRELHRVENAQYLIDYQRRRSGDVPWIDWKPRAAPVGVDFLPFVDTHAKRWAGRYWGLSEIGRNSSLFSQIDSTMTNIAAILEYHGNPLLQHPASWAFASGGVLQRGADQSYGIRNPEEAVVARYITYDGQLTAQMSNLDKAIELVLLTSEVPRSYFADPDGGAPSGTAQRLRLQNYLKKAGRYRRIEVRKTRAVVDMVLRLDDASSASGAAITDRANRLPTVTFSSPLPADEAQDAQIEEGLVTSGLSSRRTSLTRLRRVPDVDAEIAEIDADQEKAQSISFPPVAQPDPNAIDPATGLPFTQ